MAEVPRKLELAVGETWTCELESTGGGYRWQADVEGDEGIVDVSTDYAEGDVKEGGWRPDVATVTGVKAGSVDVHLVQRRSWEASGGSGGKTIRVTVRPA
jgi:hypothetical protein